MTRPLADDPQFDAWVKVRTPAKRWGKPEELGGLLVFFAPSAEPAPLQRRRTSSHQAQRRKPEKPSEIR
jgi:hypothetical protein